MTVYAVVDPIGEEHIGYSQEDLSDIMILMRSWQRECYVYVFPDGHPERAIIMQEPLQKR